MPCSRPQIVDGNVFRCRSCDGCLAARRSEWVARAMMEKATSKHALVVALTYDESTPENRDAARMFAYSDVMAFNMRLRSAMREIQPGAKMRFLCAGEQGDRNGRCHWHMVIFSDVDPRLCGSFTGKGGVRVMLPADMLSAGKRKRRLKWSLWGHGFVTLQEPDQGGMHYVLSYCLKDQFTSEKSKGTMREAKAENFATGMFRMSKRPAIGELYLFSRIERLWSLGSVLPSLSLKIPDFHGVYIPSGSFRKKLLAGLASANRLIRWRTGSDAPQWATLLAALADNQSDLEVIHGKEPEQISLETSIRLRSEETARAHRSREFRIRCGRTVPCEQCLHAATESELFAHGIFRVTRSHLWEYTDTGGKQIGSGRFVGRSHPLCKSRGSALSRFTFPDSDRTNLGT